MADDAERAARDVRSGRGDGGRPGNSQSPWLVPRPSQSDRSVLLGRADLDGEEAVDHRGRDGSWRVTPPKRRRATRARRPPPPACRPIPTSRVHRPIDLDRLHAQSGLAAAPGLRHRASCTDPWASGCTSAGASGSPTSTSPSTASIPSVSTLITRQRLGHVHRRHPAGHLRLLRNDLGGDPAGRSSPRSSPP